ncbi:reverse transcriptase domain-containing protein [Tanacetum coccineum]
MAERTMEELLRAPTEGYGEAIVLPEFNADHFEIKTNLLQLVQVVERGSRGDTDKEQQFPRKYRSNPTSELPKPNIPYPSRRDNQKSRDKASNQMEKIFQIFQDLRFDISFADALLLMPRFAPTIKSLLMNKEKLLELAKIPLNENCSAMLLKKLPEKLGDPGKFLIPCNFPGIDVCHALADLGVSINLMPFSIWKNLSLPELTPTRMTLELADQSITYPKGLASRFYQRVGKFHFPTELVVVDFEADPRLPSHTSGILSKTGVLNRFNGEEITLRVDNEAVTFNLDQTTRYSLQMISRTVGENCASWSDKLDEALWAFRTAFKTPIGCTPYKLVYRKSCHLPIELEHKAYWALKHANFDLKTAGDHRKLQLNELNELRDQAYENSLIYKERTKKLHDSKIKNRIFNVGDRVLLFNSHLKIFSGKLKTRTDIAKNHKKTIKTRQTRTRERIECTRARSLIAKRARNDTRGPNETHQEVGNYTKERPKEAQELQRCRIASLAIRVTNINPKAMMEDPMIGKDSRAEIKSKKSVC